MRIVPSSPWSLVPRAAEELDPLAPTTGEIVLALGLLVAFLVGVAVLVTVVVRARRRRRLDDGTGDGTGRDQRR